MKTEIPEKVKDLLKKVHALTTSPEKGEAESAQRTLRKLLKKYGVSLEDLEENKEIDLEIRYSHLWEYLLIIHLMQNQYNLTPYRYRSAVTGRDRKIIWCETNQIQAIEIKAHYEFLKARFLEELEALTTGFLAAYNLLSDASPGRTYTDEELEKIERAKEKLQTINRQAFHKQIEE